MHQAPKLPEKMEEILFKGKISTTKTDFWEDLGLTEDHTCQIMSHLSYLRSLDLKTSEEMAAWLQEMTTESHRNAKLMSLVVAEHSHHRGRTLIILISILTMHSITSSDFWDKTMIQLVFLVNILNTKRTSENFKSPNLSLAATHVGLACAARICVPVRTSNMISPLESLWKTRFSRHVLKFLLNGGVQFEYEQDISNLTLLYDSFQCFIDICFMYITNGPKLQKLAATISETSNWVSVSNSNCD